MKYSLRIFRGRGRKNACAFFILSRGSLALKNLQTCPEKIASPIEYDFSRPGHSIVPAPGVASLRILSCANQFVNQARACLAKCTLSSPSNARSKLDLQILRRSIGEDARIHSHFAAAKPKIALSINRIVEVPFRDRPACENRLNVRPPKTSRQVMLRVAPTPNPMRSASTKRLRFRYATPFALVPQAPPLPGYSESAFQKGGRARRKPRVSREKIIVTLRRHRLVTAPCSAPCIQNHLRSVARHM